MYREFRALSLLSADDDRVVDSRLAEDGVAIRRRRECAACNQRYTTFERIEEATLFVVKRSGEREPFTAPRFCSASGRPARTDLWTRKWMESLVTAVEESMRI